MKFRWYCSTKNTSTSTISHSSLFNLNTLDIKKKIVWIIQNDYFHHNGFKCNPQPIRVKKKTIIQAEMFLVENIFSQKIFCTKTISTNLLKKKKNTIFGFKNCLYNLTGMTRPIKDEHIRKDDFASVTNPGNAHLIDEHKTTIQYLQ